MGDPTPGYDKDMGSLWENLSELRMLSIYTKGSGEVVGLVFLFWIKIEWRKSIKVPRSVGIW